MYDMIYIVIGLIYLFIALKRFAVSMYGQIKLRQVPPQNSLKIFDMHYDRRAVLRRIGVSLIAAVLSAVCMCVSLTRFHTQALSAMLIMFLTASVIETAMLLLYYLRGRIAYLTPYGVVTAMGVYRRNQFIFAIETESGSNLKVISVLKSKTSVPVRFEVAEREDEAVSMVEQLG